MTESRWMDLWRRRGRVAAELLGLDRDAATFVTDEENQDFEEIFGTAHTASPDDDLEGWPNVTTPTVEPIPGSSLAPLRRAPHHAGWPRARTSRPGCVCPCASCRRVCRWERARTRGGDIL